ncbi:MAG: YeeE/YedE thiosulfate transporter family protein [Pseudomonadota bacterium]
MRQPDRGMNPYVAGALAGLVLTLSVLVAGKFFGASTSFVRSAGLVEQIVAPAHVEGSSYFMKYLAKNPGIDWQWMFVLGIFFGAFLASNATDSFRWTDLPDSWRDRFGPSRVKRFATAFLGGTLALFGARLADGCPSGHGLSGVAQLSVSGLVAMACFFAGGLITARMLYPGRRS